MIRAKKSLGQNFLIDIDIINQIVNSGLIKDQNVLEIGPGTGNLTRQILKKKPKQFFFIEKDSELITMLNNEFNGKINLVGNDVLKFNETKFLNDNLTVFGNLPFNISTEILCKWIINLKSNDFWFNELVLMFQKEVADRIIAKYNTSNYGRLTILSNWKLDIKKICDISPKSFVPKPKVMSTLLYFSPKKNFFKIKDPINLEKISRVFFNHRRKMIKKPFNQIFHGNLEIINKLKLDLNLRPQNLDLKTYYNLTKEYEDLRS